MSPDYALAEALDLRDPVAISRATTELTREARPTPSPATECLSANRASAALAPKANARAVNVNHAFAYETCEVPAGVSLVEWQRALNAAAALQRPAA